MSESIRIGRHWVSSPKAAASWGKVVCKKTKRDMEHPLTEVLLMIDWPHKRRNLPWPKNVEGVMREYVQETRVFGMRDESITVMLSDIGLAAFKRCKAKGFLEKRAAENEKELSNGKIEGQK